MKLNYILTYNSFVITEASVDDAVFNQRHKTQKANVGKLLGFDVPLKMVAHGSFASLYQHPTEENVLIKITSHKEDVQNTLKAQRLKSNNIVKIYNWEGDVKYKSLPNYKSWALLVEKITGSKLKYATGHFYVLAHNGEFELAKDWMDAGGSKEQKKVLEAYKSYNEQELEKLSSLFGALQMLHRIGIDLSDFEDNILDAGNRYVIIDLGF